MSESFLVLALLDTQSSVQERVSRPAEAISDTAQFWLTPNRRWRIRTHALDHDIHVYELLAKPGQPMFTPDLAQQHLRRHYANRLAKLCVLRFSDPCCPAEQAQALAQQGLSGELVQAEAGFVYYKPNADRYHTQSAALTLPQSLL